MLCLLAATLQITTPSTKSTADQTVATKSWPTDQCSNEVACAIYFMIVVGPDRLALALGLGRGGWHKEEGT